jgi:hypothetical protein
MRRRVLAALVSCALLVAAVVALVHVDGSIRAGNTHAAAATIRTTTTREATTLPPTTEAPTTTTTTAPPPPPTTTTTRRAVAAAGPVHDLTVYRGLGTWIDVYDWSTTFNRGTQLIDAADIDRMAANGVQTLYVQTAKWDAPGDVLEPERLLPLIKRAKDRGMSVVAWYLPTFADPQADMARLMAATRIPGVDALGVDIESLKLSDVAERNRRLVEISTHLRAALPNLTLGAIPFPPVATDVINPKLWPNFPWAQLAPLYDVWLPMSYQTERTQESGYRDAYRYTAENIDRLRAHLGRPTVPVHAIGGIADRMVPSDVSAMLRAAVQRHAIGGSLYDWRTTGPDLLPALQGFRR